MGSKNISGSSFSMSNEVNFLGKKTVTRSKGKSWPKLTNSEVRQPVNAAPFVGSALGAIPNSSGSSSVSAMVMAALGAVGTAGTILVKQDSATGQFTTDYALALQKVMNGAYAKNGKLNEEELRQIVAVLIGQMLQQAGPCMLSWRQVLMEAMQCETFDGFMKGIQSVVCALTGDPINANTGNFLYEKEDLVIKGRQSLHFRRFYNRIDKRCGSMGKGWRHNYEISLLIQEDRYVIIWDDGREEIYLREAGQLPEALFGCTNRLEELEDGFTYLTQEGIHYSFNKKGQLTKTSNKNGQGLLFLYDKNGWLSQVSNGAGAYLSYRYEQRTGQLIQIADHSGRMVTLTYELGRLAKVTSPLGQSYTYYYDKDNSISKIRNPKNIFVLKNTYDDRGRTVQQEFADGGVIQYDYQDEQSRTLMTEQNGNRIAYERDDKYRNVKTIYNDGEETFAYNDRNQRTLYIDKNGNKTRYSYDDKGNVSQILYPNGSKHNMTYDVNNRLLVLSANGKVKVKNSYDFKGNLLSTEDALGRGRTYLRQEDGAIREIIQADGSKLTFEYDSKANIEKIADAAGNSTIYSYDDINRVTRTIDGKGNRTCYDYDAANQLTKVINADGKTRSYEYTKNGKLAKMVDFNGAVTSQAYNDMNLVKILTTPDGGTMQMEYDQMQNVTKRVLPDGAEFLYAYDALNRLEQLTLPTGGILHYEYDANGNQTSVTDANGNKTTMEYDELNRIISVTETDGAKVEYEYDMEGNLVSVTNAVGQSHIYQYDAVGQKISETDILGNTVTYEYNNMGKIICIIDPQKQKFCYEYGAGGVLEKTLYPNGMWEKYTYDANSNLIRRENQKGAYLEFDYDCLDRMVKIQSSFGQEQSYTYNALGNVTSMTDATGNVTNYEYSINSNLIAVTDAEGNMTEYAYDGTSRLTTIFRHDGSTTRLGQDGNILSGIGAASSAPLRLTRYERDGLGNITRVLDPLGNEEKYEYDRMGRLVKKTDKEGYQTAYAYTPYNKLNQVTYDDGRSVELSYNALRQLIQVNDWLGITEIEPDSVGRPKKVTDYAGREVRYHWSQTGKREAVIYPDGKKVSYEYNDMGQLCHMEYGTMAVDYQYTEEGFLSGKQYANHLETLYEYNEIGYLESLTHQYEGHVLEDYYYRYDLLGNKTEIKKVRNAAVDQISLPEEIRSGLKETSGVYHYRYDALNRLTRVERHGSHLRSYEYDAYGNRIRQYDGEKRNSTTYSYNVMDQLMTRGKESYQYDQRGNLSAVINDGQIVTGYQYDETNRLSKAFNVNGQMASYQYNGLGNRVGYQEYAFGSRSVIRTAKDINWNVERDLNPAREIDYVLDMTRQYHNLLIKTETDGQMENRQDYMWDSNVVSMTEGERGYLYLQDELGSPVRLLDMQGNSQMAYGYDEFGQDLFGNRGEVQPFGYTGYQKDTIIDTYFAQAREYQPKVGRFCGEDVVKGSLVEPKTLNSYNYCWGNPIIFIDLDGRIGTLVDKVIDIAYEKTDVEITEKEAYLSMLYPKQAFIVKDCAAVANEWTDKIFGEYYLSTDPAGIVPPNWLDGDAANAYRHAMWNALLKQAFMSGTDAKMWTDAHEAWPEERMLNENWNGYSRLEHTNMDYHNNAIGRSCVAWYEFYLSPEEISNRILEELRKGEMVYLVDHGWYNEILECPNTQ